jgi:hypothetical protein
LPADPSSSAVLDAAAAGADPDLSRWAILGAARLKNGAPFHGRLPPLAAAACGEPGDPVYCAIAALTLGDVVLEGAALGRLPDEERPLKVALVSALGASRDPRALGSLMNELASVRTRLEVVDALIELGDRRVLPTIERWIPSEPYVPVRAKMARLLGALGAGEEGGGARRALEELKASERDAPVRAEIDAALAALATGPSPSPAR